MCLIKEVNEPGIFWVESSNLFQEILNNNNCYLVIATGPHQVK